MSRSIWSELGIAPTGDASAIRRAYARRLKTIDVESDAAGFIALRAAFEAAQAMARRAPRQEFPPETEPETAADTVEDPGEAEAAPEPDPAATATIADEPPPFVETGREAVIEVAPEPEPEPEPLAPDDFERIQALVFGTAPREAIFDEVALRTQRILASAALDGIERAAAIERWMAETIVAAIPRSNAMLAPAINRFGWNHAIHEWRCPPIVQQVMKRYEDCRFVDEASRPTHRFAHPYRLLTAPVAKKKLRWSDSEAINEFLTMIRSRFPSAETSLDSGAVAAWDAWFVRERNRPSTRLLDWIGPVRGTRAGSVRLVAGIIFVPHIACWFLLRPGYSRTARLMGFGWAFFWATAYVLSLIDAPPP